MTLSQLFLLLLISLLSLRLRTICCQRPFPGQWITRKFSIFTGGRIFISRFIVQKFLIVRQTFRVVVSEPRKCSRLPFISPILNSRRRRTVPFRFPKRQTSRVGVCSPRQGRPVPLLLVLRKLVLKPKIFPVMTLMIHFLTLPVVLRSKILKIPPFQFSVSGHGTSFHLTWFQVVTFNRRGVPGQYPS